MEQWRKIPGFPAHYEASSEGRIRRLPYEHPRVLDNGRVVMRRLPEKVFPLERVSMYGYRRIRLLGHTHFVHRLVATAWLENPEALPQINHKNADKTDNRVENIEWVSNQANRDHAVAAGLQARGSRTSHALDESDVVRIRDMAAKGAAQATIADEYGIGQTTVSHIVRRSTWKHV